MTNDNRIIQANEFEKPLAAIQDITRILYEAVVTYVPEANQDAFLEPLQSLLDELDLSKAHQRATWEMGQYAMKRSDEIFRDAEHMLETQQSRNIQYALDRDYDWVKTFVAALKGELMHVASKMDVMQFMTAADNLIESIQINSGSDVA